jgi:hypothetical protein
MCDQARLAFARVLADAFGQQRAGSDDHPGHERAVEEHQHLGQACGGQQAFVAEPCDIGQRQDVHEEYRKQAQRTGTDHDQHMSRNGAFGERRTGLRHGCSR